MNSYGVEESKNGESQRQKRHRSERNFRRLGLSAILFALSVLVLLLATITLRGYKAFHQHEIALEFDFDPERFDIDPENDPELRNANFNLLVKSAILSTTTDKLNRKERRALFALVSSGASFELRTILLGDLTALGKKSKLSIPLSDDADMLLKGAIPREVPESDRILSDRQISWVDMWLAQGRISRVFNHRFFSNGDSRNPELAGIWGALVGSMWTILITLMLCFPIGVAAAIYLEVFAKKNKLNDFIEVNINNLAAVPSIVFGLLGLAVFLNFFGFPRSAPLVGGMVLALMTLPTVIIAARSSIAAVPPSITEAAMGMGASPLQVVLHHVLPLAMPGVLTGTIIGMARALGETAPLLMIGMVAFIVDVPDGPMTASTVLPVQVYLWADSPERAFVEKTSAAIMVLLVFLILMNLAAVLLRNRFEKRW